MSTAVELPPEPAATTLPPAATPASVPGSGPVPASTAVPASAVPPVADHPTRGQRLALAAGLIVAVWLVLRLFDSVLAPFVAAAVIAYALDPPTSYLTRLGVPRGLAALLMILALLFALLLFALLLLTLLLRRVLILVVVLLIHGFLSAFAGVATATTAATVKKTPRGGRRLHPLTH